MNSYLLSPFADFVESQLVPNAPQFAVFHRLTSQLIEPLPMVRSLLDAVRKGKRFVFDGGDLRPHGPEGHQVHALIDQRLLVLENEDPLAAFVDYLMVRPLQNPALTYRTPEGKIRLVRLSMTQKVYSPKPGELPAIIEEDLSPLAVGILLASDGNKTLQEIHADLRPASDSLLDDDEFRNVFNSLTTTEMQLIKLTNNPHGLYEPFYPVNIVPRNLYHSARWSSPQSNAESIKYFHTEGIENADWEFDIVEPTINHALRFPSTLLNGQDYGSRFCDALLQSADFAEPAEGLRVLEVGGGRGSFARSFINCLTSQRQLNSYQIMDVSPALTESQMRLVKGLVPAVGHIAQDATTFDLPGHFFDLIIANEVIADLPVAAIERENAGTELHLTGDGADACKKYGLALNDAPDRFYLNSGALAFLERAWGHLAPGGVVVITEYGSESDYPAESFHLNHSEFSIHFGHLMQCAAHLGFECRLESLQHFLGIDDQQPVLSGRHEHLICLNHIFEKQSAHLPFALYSEVDFRRNFEELAVQSVIQPIRFLGLRKNYYYEANIDGFLALILSKPTA